MYTPSATGLQIRHEFVISLQYRCDSWIARTTAKTPVRQRHGPHTSDGYAAVWLRMARVLIEKSRQRLSPRPDHRENTCRIAAQSSRQSLLHIRRTTPSSENCNQRRARLMTLTDPGGVRLMVTRVIVIETKRTLMGDNMTECFMNTSERTTWKTRDLLYRGGASYQLWQEGCTEARHTSRCRGRRPKEHSEKQCRPPCHVYREAVCCARFRTGLPRPQGQYECVVGLSRAHADVGAIVCGYPNGIQAGRDDH